MVEGFIKEVLIKFERAVSHLDQELSTIHTGRASVSLVDSIMVEVYGSKQSIKQIASITIPEPKQILVQPWDKSIISSIEKAIRESDLKFSPVNTGDSIRINIPELTEERRKEYVKVVHEKGEEAKVTVRTARQDTWNEIKKTKVDGRIGEDEMYRGENLLQHEVEKINKTIDEKVRAKEAELMEV